MVANVPGAATHMLANGLSYRLIDSVLRNRASLQAVKKTERGHQEAGGGVATLKGEVFEEGGLQGMELTIPGKPLDGGHDFSVHG